MKRWLIAAAAAAMAMSAVPIGASAGDNEGQTTHFTIHSTADPDHGSCGNLWALDTFDRVFTVHDNGDGTLRVHEEFKDGTFVTTGGVSPGACETEHHGAVVLSGITGTVHGSVRGTVTGQIFFNPAGCATLPKGCTTGGEVIAATFGPAAAFNITSFNFEYSSGDKRLEFHHWSDRSGPDGTEVFKGDIATE